MPNKAFLKFWATVYINSYQFAPLAIVNTFTMARPLCVYVAITFKMAKIFLLFATDSVTMWIELHYMSLKPINNCIILENRFKFPRVGTFDPSHSRHCFRKQHCAIHRSFLTISTQNDQIGAQKRKLLLKGWVLDVFWQRRRLWRKWHRKYPTESWGDWIRWDQPQKVSVMTCCCCFQWGFLSTDSMILTGSIQISVETSCLSDLQVLL